MSNSKVDLTNAYLSSTLSPEQTVTLQLAREFEGPEDGRPPTSWENQEKAQAYFNAYGFAATLTHMLEMRDKNKA